METRKVKARRTHELETVDQVKFLIGDRLLYKVNVLEDGSLQFSQGLVVDYPDDLFDWVGPNPPPPQCCNKAARLEVLDELTEQAQELDMGYDDE